MRIRWKNLGQLRSHKKYCPFSHTNPDNRKLTPCYYEIKIAQVFNEEMLRSQSNKTLTNKDKWLKRKEKVYALPVQMESFVREFSREVYYLLFHSFIYKVNVGSHPQHQQTNTAWFALLKHFSYTIKISKYKLITMGPKLKSDEGNQNYCTAGILWNTVVDCKYSDMYTLGME